MEVRFAVWNMEWMNDLFTDGPSFHPDAKEVRGPSRGRNRPTVIERRDSLSRLINDAELEVLVIVEGPNLATELQLFFDTDVAGDWVCDVQPSKGSSQIVGIAVRTDTDKFTDTPITRIHIGSGQGGEAKRLSDATQPFLIDTDDDEISEQHKFERLPLYFQLNFQDGKICRVLGLHLKSKGIFDRLEWSKWWAKADANRKKILAQCTQLRGEFLDYYLSEDATRDIPIIVCGDINDGPGMDSSERRLDASGVERLMGTVWKPGLTLRNALYDALDDEERWDVDLSSVYTTSFKDPLFQTYRKVWIDHILYSNPRSTNWLKDAEVLISFLNENNEEEKVWERYPNASDHFPIVAVIDTHEI